jgi:hypothetical protein
MLFRSKSRSRQPSSTSCSFKTPSIGLFGSNRSMCFGRFGSAVLIALSPHANITLLRGSGSGHTTNTKSFLSAGEFTVVESARTVPTCGGNLGIDVGHGEFRMGLEVPQPIRGWRKIGLSWELFGILLFHRHTHLLLKPYPIHRHHRTPADFIVARDDAGFLSLG